MKTVHSPLRRPTGLIRRQAGMTLIEVLISVLILVIGLLGLAAMQMQSVKFNDSAKWRSQATFLAYDIVERIRANKNELSSYSHVADAEAPGGSTVAAKDLQEWLAQLALINGAGSSVVINDKKVTVTIKISDLARTDANAADTTFVYTTLLD